MKKFLGIVILCMLIFNINSTVYADSYVIGVIKNTHKQLPKATAYESVFLLSELANAMQLVGNVSSKCYRVLVTKGKKYYNKDKNCLKFRALFGNTAQEYNNNIRRVKDIFKLNMDREARNFYQGTNSDLYFRHMETITLNFAKLVQVAKIVN